LKALILVCDCGGSQANRFIEQLLINPRLLHWKLWT
jgi:hypothetical protein